MNIYHLPCVFEGCGSSDAVTYYPEKDNAYCFSCSHYYFPGEYPQPTISKEKKKLEKTNKQPLKVLPDEYQAIPDRKLTEASAKKYGIRVLGDRHAYPFTRNGKHVSTQYRTVSDKDFYWENFVEGLELFGQSSFPDGSHGARQVTIVEGALDAASAYQLTGSTYPVVGVYSAATAEKEIKANLNWLNTFEKVVLCFDADKPGQDAAEKCARALPVGKVRIVKLQHGKDPSEYLQKDLSIKFQKEWFQGADWTPSGLRLGSELWDDIIVPPNLSSVAWPWDTIQQMTYGIRKSEVVIIHAKTGVGKSTILNEIQYAILNSNKDSKLGLLRLEETNRDSAVGLMSVHANKRLHLPDVWAEQSESDLRQWYDEVVNTDRIVLLDHFGSNKVDEVLNQIRYMNALGCDYIIIDHLSIIVSDQSGDERKQLDEISTKLKMLCMERNIGVIAVIHENRSGEIRGSAGVEQLGNTVIGLERDIKSHDPFRRAVTRMTIEKNRFAGMTGPSSYLFFEKETGRLRDMSQDQIDQYEQGYSE